jgi:hypothetical protein
VNFNRKTAAAAMLAAAPTASSAYASSDRDPNAQAKKHTTQKSKTPPPPTIEKQIQALRQEIQGQIDCLKTDLADKDAQLKAGPAPVASAPRASTTCSKQASATICRSNGPGVGPVHAGHRVFLEGMERC